MEVWGDTHTSQLIRLILCWLADNSQQSVWRSSMGNKQDNLTKTLLASHGDHNHGCSVKTAVRQLANDLSGAQDQARAIIRHTRSQRC